MTVHELLRFFGYFDSPRRIRAMSELDNDKVSESFSACFPKLRFEYCKKEEIAYLIDALVVHGLHEKVKYVAIYGHAGFDSLPENFTKLTSVDYIYINAIDLKELPEDIDKLTSLTNLNVVNSKLTTLPAAFAKLGNLKSLSLAYNKLQSVPDFVFNLPQLERLTLFENPLSELPQNIHSSTLKSLDLSRCKFETLPACLVGLKALESLILLETPIRRIPNNPELVRLARRVNLNMLPEAPPCIAKMAPEELGNLFTAEAVQKTLEAVQAERMGVLLWLMSNGYLSQETLPGLVQGAVMDQMVALEFEQHAATDHQEGTGQFFAASFFDRKEEGLSVSKVDRSKIKDQSFLSNLKSAKEKLVDTKKMEAEIEETEKTIMPLTKKNK